MLSSRSGFGLALAFGVLLILAGCGGPTGTQVGGTASQTAPAGTAPTGKADTGKADTGPAGTSKTHVPG